MDKHNEINTLPLPKPGGGVRPLVVKSALHYHANEMPCNWDVNVYRGCGHGCRYCFATYTHDYMEAGDFFSNIFVKTNVAQVLDRELSRRSWRRERINLSGVTDAYQPAEAGLKMMPAVWKVLIRHRNPVVITTKSSLILRDLELIRELASVTRVSVGASITLTDEGLRRKIEPETAPAEERFSVLEKCREAGCTVNVMLTPVLPLISDTYENLDGIFRMARSVGVDGLSSWPLNLRGRTKDKFFRFLEAEFPGLREPYRGIYRGGEPGPVWLDGFLAMKEGLKKKYGIPSISLPAIESRPVQLSLF